MIILASHSPRRQALLKRIIPAFESHPAAINERALPILPPPEYVQSLAKAKGESLVPSYPGATIIAADTMVAFQGKLLGKPHSRAEAKQMITALGGQTHQVYTGLWVRLDNGTIRQQVVATDVTFGRLMKPKLSRIYKKTPIKTRRVLMAFKTPELYWLRRSMVIFTTSWVCRSVRCIECCWRKAFALLFNRMEIQRL